MLQIYAKVIGLFIVSFLVKKNSIHEVMFQSDGTHISQNSIKERLGFYGSQNKMNDARTMQPRDGINSKLSSQVPFRASIPSLPTSEYLFMPNDWLTSSKSNFLNPSLIVPLEAWRFQLNHDDLSKSVSSQYGKYTILEKIFKRE